MDRAVTHLDPLVAKSRAVFLAVDTHIRSQARLRGYRSRSNYMDQLVLIHDVFSFHNYEAEWRKMEDR